MPKPARVSETPAVACLKANGVTFSEHPYQYLERGGAQHSGYMVGGTSPFATRKKMPVYVERSILTLPKICINGGRRGYLVSIDPAVCVRLLEATPVDCALQA